MRCTDGTSIWCPSGTQTCSDRTSCSILCDGLELHCPLRVGESCSIPDDP